MKSYQQAAMLLGIAAATSLGACSTIVNGSHQAMGVITTPTGATCTLTRKGQVLAQISPTPGQVQVDKSKEDIIVGCDKTGYQHTEVVAKSTFNGTTVANILAGGVIGLAVDAASGANNDYPDNISVTLTPLGAPEPVPAAAPGKAATPTS